MIISRYIFLLRGHPAPTFAAPAGPSSLEICSFACFGRSTVLVRGRRPKRNDILDVGVAPLSNLKAARCKTTKNWVSDWDETDSSVLCSIAWNEAKRRYQQGHE